MISLMDRAKNGKISLIENDLNKLKDFSERSKLKELNVLTTSYEGTLINTFLVEMKNNFHLVKLKIIIDNNSFYSLDYNKLIEYLSVSQVIDFTLIVKNIYSYSDLLVNFLMKNMDIEKFILIIEGNQSKKLQEKIDYLTSINIVYKQIQTDNLFPVGFLELNRDLKNQLIDFMILMSRLPNELKSFILRYYLIELKNSL